jgi:hypothetical protein
MVDPDGHFPWSIFIDIGLIAAGILIGAETSGAVGAIVASIFHGAGTAGLSYDTRNGPHDTNWADWGKAVGVGAAFGAVSGVTDEAINFASVARSVRVGIQEGVNDAQRIAQRTIALRLGVLPVISSLLEVAHLAATDAALGNRQSPFALGFAAVTGYGTGFGKALARDKRLVGNIQERLDRSGWDEFLTSGRARGRSFADEIELSTTPYVELADGPSLTARASLTAPTPNMP